MVQQHAGSHHAQPGQQVRGQHLEEDHPGALSGGNMELRLLHLVRTPAEAEVHLRSSKLSLLMCAEALPTGEDQPLFVFLSVSLPSPLNTHTDGTNVAIINIYLIADHKICSDTKIYSKILFESYNQVLFLYVLKIVHSELIREVVYLIPLWVQEDLLL